MVPMEIAALISFDSLCLPVNVFNLGSGILPCDLTSLMDLRVVDFTVCSTFYLLGQSDNFQASYMLNQKVGSYYFPNSQS